MVAHIFNPCTQETGCEFQAYLVNIVISRPGRDTLGGHNSKKKYLENIGKAGKIV